MSEENILNTQLCIQKIQLDLKRILDHHVEFKIMFKDFEDALKIERNERINSIAEVKDECAREVSNIYKNVAGYGITTIVMIVCSIIGYIAYKL